MQKITVAGGAFDQAASQLEGRRDFLYVRQWPMVMESSEGQLNYSPNKTQPFLLVDHAGRTRCFNCSVGPAKLTAKGATST